MKYLKKYNENKEESLKDFCEMYLSYLMDDGFKIEVCEEDNSYWDSNPNDSYTIVSLQKNREEDEGWDYDGVNCFKWEDVKDHYIPFLQMLAKSYQMSKISYYNNEYADVIAIDFNGNSVLSSLPDFISGKYNNDLNTIDIGEIKVGVNL